MKQVSLPFAIVVAALMFVIGVVAGVRFSRTPELQAAVAMRLAEGRPTLAMQQGGASAKEEPVSYLPDESMLHVTQVRGRLRELVMLEEVQYADLGTYTQDMSRLATQHHPADSVDIVFRYAGPDGWVADASHPALPGRTCVVYVGDAARLPASAITARDGIRPTHPAEIACDE